jgi:hypothetical protein
MSACGDSCDNALVAAHSAEVEHRPIGSSAAPNRSSCHTSGHPFLPHPVFHFELDTCIRHRQSPRILPARYRIQAKSRLASQLLAFILIFVK